MKRTSSTLGHMEVNRRLKANGYNDPTCAVSVVNEVLELLDLNTGIIIFDSGSVGIKSYREWLDEMKLRSKLLSAVAVQEKTGIKGGTYGT